MKPCDMKNVEMTDLHKLQVEVALRIAATRAASYVGWIPGPIKNI